MPRAVRTASAAVNAASARNNAMMQTANTAGGNGPQAICTAFGGTITYARELMHGKQSLVTLDRDCPLFHGCPETSPVARYHSLAADPDTLPACLKVTAVTADGEVMAVQHREYPIYGVQFHPESILTPDGKTMLRNFIKEI